MLLNFSPARKMKRQLPGEPVLDALFGLGALVLLLPALPVIVLVWLVSRLWGPVFGDRSLEREPRYTGESHVEEH